MKLHYVRNREYLLCLSVIRQASLLFIISVGSVIAPIAHCEAAEQELIGFRQSVYTQQFARRFGLDETLTFDLGDGVYAVEFRIDKHDGHYSCGFNLYLDNALPVKYPDGDSGRLDYEDNLLSYKNIREWLPEDKQYAMRRKMTYLMRAFVSSVDFSFKQKKGFRTSMVISQFDKEYLPGVSYLALRLLVCSLPEIAAKKERILILLERNRGADYTKEGILDLDDFYEIQIPESLSNSAVDAAIKAKHDNRFNWMK